MDGRRQDTWFIEELDIDTNECPAHMVTADSWRMLGLYQHYTSGHLPLAGGILEQPHAFADAMRIIAAEVNSE